MGYASGQQGGKQNSFSPLIYLLIRQLRNLPDDSCFSHVRVSLDYGVYYETYYGYSGNLLLSFYLLRRQVADDPNITDNAVETV